LKIPLKLYIWDSPCTPAYGGDVLVVLARTLKEARKKAEEATEVAFGMFGKNNKRVSIPTKSKPRIIKSPKAEYHWWSE